MKPAETSHNAENSRVVRSDFVGMRFMRKKTRSCRVVLFRQQERVESLDAKSFRPVS